MIEFDIMQNNFESLITKGEKYREQEKFAEALSFFDQAIIVAGNSEDYSRVVNTIGHKLLIYKILYENTGKSLYMELFFGETLSGMNLVESQDLTGQPKALMMLRQGDYFTYKNNHAKAVKYFGNAIEILPDDDRAPHAEYIAYYGLSLILNGDKVKGFEKLAEALKFANENTELRDFHKMIILSGMHLRYAQAYNSINEPVKAKESLEKGEKIAKQLHREYRIDTRLHQIEKFKKLNNII